MKTAAALASCLSVLLPVAGAAVPGRDGSAVGQGGPRRRLDAEGAVTDAGYDSYATSWRYLGAFLDCGKSSSSFSWSFSSLCKYCRRTREEERELRASSCKKPTRRLLWAAYRDPYYEGGEIGEYEFYDADDGEWDDSTCVGDRCAKMDCHDPYNSKWELMGVYKETVSFDNDMFFEQLFKHQGYCLWDGDKEGYDYGSQDTDAWESGSTYWFMQAMRKELPEGCTKVSLNGGTYYVDMKPQSKGDMTLGVYKDSGCTEESDLTYEDYQSYYASSGSLTASASSGAFDTWNSGMDAYKTCQPCRAYNREVVEDDGGRRRLTEYNDGQGDEESNGYNCYDDAGYQNCNQCYKFETHSDMQAASAGDLADADAQGTILRIEYNGRWYGNGFVGDVTQGTENEDEGSSSGGQQSSGRRKSSSSSSSSWRSSSSSRNNYRSQYGSQYMYSRMRYSFAGAAVVLALGAAVRARRRTTRGRGTLDDDVDENDAYVEMAAPQS